VTLWAWLPKSHLRPYLSAQLAYNVSLETIVLAGHDETTRLYHFAYYLFTSIILATMLEVTLIYMQAHPHPGLLMLSSAVLSLTTFAFAYVGLPKPLHGYDRFMLLEATTLLFCGTCTGLASAFMRTSNRPVAASLAVLWIALALFRFGFNLNISQTTWIRLNLWLPFWLVCSEFLYLGFKLRRMNETAG